MTRRSSFLFNGISSGGAQVRGQTFGLVEFAFALFHRMQRNRHDQIPVLPAQRGHRLAQKQAGEKRLKPQLRAGICSGGLLPARRRGRRPPSARNVKCSSISRQFVHSNGVVMSPSNGRPQRSQNGGLMKRTCDQQRAQTKPSLAVARVRLRKAGRFRDRKSRGRC